jgi:hypothetical protein
LIYKLRIHRKNVIILITQLKRVIKLASQLEDKSESNIARRLELSLRLSEAEGIFEIVSLSFGKYSKYK